MELFVFDIFILLLVKIDMDKYEKQITPLTIIALVYTILINFNNLIISNIYGFYKVENYVLGIMAVFFILIFMIDNCLDSRVFDDDAFVKLCYEADDVWLKCMALLKNTKVVWVPNNEVDLPEVENNFQTGLSQSNVGENKNDMYLKNVMEAYDIEANDFFQ